MYTDAEYEERRGWGHSTWDGAVATAEAARVKKLVLFHHDPERDDRSLDAVLKRAQRRFPHTVAAREGLTLRLAAGG